MLLAKDQLLYNVNELRKNYGYILVVRCPCNYVNQLIIIVGILHLIIYADQRVVMSVSVVQ